jgi:hypothetical protein
MYLTTRPHILEDGILNIYHCENISFNLARLSNNCLSLCGC